MKNTALLDPQIDSLLAEVRYLRDSVTDLETRLADYEGEPENPWGIWPYCWVVQGWEQTANGLEKLQQKVDRWSITKRNRRQQRRAPQQPIGELNLI